MLSNSLLTLLCLAPLQLGASEMRVYPSQVRLAGKLDHQTLVVQLRTSTGITRDVTDQVQWSLSRTKIVQLKGNRLRPVAAGACLLTAKFGQHVAKVPVQVVAPKRFRPTSFRLDVMPVFMKAGCNSGTCHGFSRGQNGFRLSVFGFDPLGDHFRLTRQFIGRRINLAEPRESLILTKPSGEVAHGGGQRFKAGDRLYATIERWIEAGASLEKSNPIVPIHLDVFPPDAVLETGGKKQKLTVRATYSDGSTRDVTELAVLSSSNSTTTKINRETIVSGKRGESFVMARFASFAVGIPVIVVPANQSFQFPVTKQRNYIDKLIDEKLRKLRIVPAGLCTDEEFVRRVFLDMVGTLPNVSEYRAFMADRRRDKRARLVDQLLKRPGFTDIWVMKWAELLQIRRIKGGFFNWLTKRFQANVPMDRLVRELLTAEGGFFRDPPVQYFERVGDPAKLAENAAQVFMGTRIQCARCHNHPFDRWTMDDYFGFAAFFAQLGYKRAPEDSREKIVFNQGSGDIRHPTTNQIALPTFLGGGLAKVKPGQDRRAVLAHWLTEKGNPWFSRNLANIAWAQFFGRGIIDPVDDVRISNPPSNERLLKTLAAKLVGYNYDFRKLIRDICLSRTYQASSSANASNKSDTRNFARAQFRRLRAEVLHDSICQATSQPSRLGGFPLGTRAVELPVAAMSTYFLKTFGRSDRETVCSCEVDVQPTLSQTLHLINGETIWQKVKQGSVIAKRLQADTDETKIIEELYIRCLTRKPDREELNSLAKLLSQAKDKKEWLEDLFWALLNSKEFLFNH